jgi:hypothetical protein
MIRLSCFKFLCLLIRGEKNVAVVDILSFNIVMYIYRYGQDIKVSMGFQIVLVPSLFLFTSVMGFHYVLLLSKFVIILSFLYKKNFRL